MSLFEELKRRNVFRVGIAYLVVAWLVAQVADLVLENIPAPDWLMQTILLLLAIGFPLALIFAWAFEMTPEGIKKEKDVDRSQSITHETGRKLNGMIMAMLVLAVGYFAYDKFILRSSPEAEPAAEVVVAEAPIPAETGRGVQEKSIAVLPFANRSNRQEDEFFTEGIHDDLLTHLSKIGSMKVISRTSVLRYKETEKPIPEIAAELKVTTILEGGIQRSGDQVRINVQLIDAETDEHLWAEIFDRQLTAENLFAIQSEIATKIAEALEATLSPEEESRLQEIPTTNMAAYNAYLRGRQLQARRTSADLEKAMAEFTRAAELDPEYALAWVGLAETANLLTGYGTLPIDEAIEIEDQAIKKALAIDSELGEAYASLANQNVFRQDFEKAETAYLKAIELSPNYATAYQWYSGFLTNFPDRFDESLTLLEKAAELDPLSSIIQTGLANLYVRLGRFEEAESLFKRLIELDPDFAINYNNLARFYSDSVGRFADALKYSRIAQQKDPGNVQMLWMEAYIYLNVADYEAAESTRQKLADIDPQHFIVGMTDSVMNIYEENMAGSMESAQWTLSKVANHPNFQQFVAFVHAWSGDYEKARELTAQAFPGWENPEEWDSLIQAHTANSCIIAAVYAGAGEQEMAEKLIARIFEYYELIKTEIDRPYTLAPVDCWVANGQYDQAMSVLEQQVENGFITWWWANYQWPWWDNVRSEPRFQAAMQSIQDQVAEQSRLIAEMKL